MNVVGIKRLDDFVKKHADVRSQVQAWLIEAEEAQWLTPLDIKERYVTASFVGNNGVIFNLKGNNYRLYVRVIYEYQMVIVKKIGTHDEYSKWNIEG